jgi:hypothetical protein
MELEAVEAELGEFIRRFMCFYCAFHVLLSADSWSFGGGCRVGVNFDGGEASGERRWSAQGAEMIWNLLRGFGRCAAFTPGNFHAPSRAKKRQI